MRQIIYYVATSIDGFICGPNEDVSGFAPDGNGVAQYLKDLQAFDTTIMGRKTYEFGYKFGMQAGQPAYAHMDHYIFSNSLKFENPHPKVKVCALDLASIKALKLTEGSPIYLCGGGQFAGWLLENELIDVVKVKLNPLILSDGVRLFGESKKQYKLKLIAKESYEGDLQFLTYNIQY